jgi:hypothetical protein
MAKHQVDGRPNPEPPDGVQGAHESGTWDKVDEAGWESFPASDAPGHGPREHVAEAKVIETEDQRSRRKMLHRLGRELFQTESSARLHCRREAERLGEVPPARALLATAEHADEALKSMIEHTKRSELPLSIAGAMVGVVFSTTRELVLDRLLSSEQSYRGTLLGMKHGVDLVRLINQLAQRAGDFELLEWTDDWLRRREPLVQEAEARLTWFADNVEIADRVARPLLAHLPFFR